MTHKSLRGINIRTRKTGWIAGLALLLPIAMLLTAFTEPVSPEAIPAARLIRNLTEHLKKNAADAQAFYTRGRVHYFAFALGTESVSVIGRYSENKSDIPRLYDFMGAKRKPYPAYPPGEKLTREERVAHLRSAIADLRKAIELRDKSKSSETGGLYELCLAGAFEEGIPFAQKLGKINNVGQTASAWKSEAFRLYGEAFDRSADRDRAATHEEPMWGLVTLVSFEAGEGYKRLAPEVSARTPAAKTRLEKIEKHRAALSQLPPLGVITPLVFSLEAKKSLTSLLSERTVSFDLDGTHLPQRYSWVQPDTAILVWDPEGTGTITSGRQLFGSVTWWMFWDNAYQAMNALDDNHDGWLTGKELVGLALWFDRNQNGLSEPGEVVPLYKTPIAALSTQTTERVGNAPMNPQGVRLNDGRTLPTYDWVTEPRLDKPGH